MDLPSIIRAIISPTPEKTDFKLGTLQSGAMLQGTILGARKGGKTLVDFGNFRVFAEIKFPVDTGDVLRVRVIDSGEQLTLKLIDITSPLSETDKENIRSERVPLNAEYLSKLRSALMNILEKNTSLPAGEKLPLHIKNALQVIGAHVEPIEIGSESIKLMEHLKSQVQASGFLYEKILENLLIHDAADKPTKKYTTSTGLQSLARENLKPNLQILREFFIRQEVMFPNVAKKEIALIRGAVNTLFDDVIGQQHNTLAGQLEPDQTQFFTYFLNLKGSKRLTKLRVYYRPKKKTDPSETSRISLLLNMDKLGEIRSDISLLTQAIHVDFFVPDEKVKQVIEENLPAIKLPLAALFKNLSLAVMVSKAKIADFTHKELNRVANTTVDIRV